MRYISIDAGRSSIKLCDEKLEPKKIPAKHSLMDFSTLVVPPSLSARKQDLIVQVNGHAIYILGKSCDLLADPKKIIHITDDELYLEYSASYTLATVATMIEDEEEVFLSINFTYNNDRFKKEFSDKLKEKQHIVNFFNTEGEIIRQVKFEIKELIVVFQGWIAILNEALDANDNYKLNTKYVDPGIVIDIGRKTTDVIFSNEFQIRKALSFNIGMEDVYKFIKQKLIKEYSIDMDTFDIEEAILKNRLLNIGKIVGLDLKKYLPPAVSYAVEMIKTNIVDNFNNYSFSWGILVGGGSYYFESVLKKYFPFIEMSDDPIFANVMGQEKFLLRDTVRQQRRIIN